MWSTNRAHTRAWSMGKLCRSWRMVLLKSSSKRSRAQATQSAVCSWGVVVLVGHSHESGMDGRDMNMDHTQNHNPPPLSHTHRHQHPMPTARRTLVALGPFAEGLLDALQRLQLRVLLRLRKVFLGVCVGCWWSTCVCIRRQSKRQRNGGELDAPPTQKTPPHHHPASKQQHS